MFILYYFFIYAHFFSFITFITFSSLFIVSTKSESSECITIYVSLATDSVFYRIGAEYEYGFCWQNQMSKIPV